MGNVFSELCEYMRGKSQGASLRDCVMGVRAIREDCMPYPLEQACFVEFLAVRKPKYICEIGMSLGVSLWLMSRAATDDAVVIGVEHTKDLPAKDFAAYGRAQQTLITVRGDAHTPETVAEVKHFLGGHLLDVLYLDADHTVEDLAIEMGCYVGLVRGGGIVACDDTCSNGGKDIDFVKIPNNLDELKQNLKDYLEPLGLWHEPNFGLYSILYCSY